MWKESLVARFTHRRSESLNAPLISSRPLSTVTLDPVPESPLDDPLEQHCERPVPESPNRPSTNNPSGILVTVTPHAEHMDKKADPDSQPVVPTLTQSALDVESIQSLGMRSVRSYFMQEIDTAQAAAPLTAYCFMTGFIDAVTFSAIFVWCAFQTGNSVQLALALARLFDGQHDYSFHLADQQALCSVLCFVFGAFLGRIGDKMGCKTRAWMALGTFIQTLFTMSAAIVMWKSHSGSVGDSRGDPAWTNTLTFVVIGFMSASMGLQGIMGKRLNTQFTTTVVLTTTWCELMTEPQLFNFRRLVASRDHKVMAILFLFIGGFVSRAILDRLGSAATLGVGTGLRFVIALWWLFVPAKKAT